MSLPAGASTVPSGASTCTTADTAQVIRDRQSFLVMPHTHIDGDDLGSMIALRQGLFKLGKSVTLYTCDEVPDMFAKLEGVEHLTTTPPTGHYDAALLLEVTDLSRLPPGIDLAAQCGTIVNIDHHPDNGYYAPYNYVDPAAAACGEMVYRLLKELKIPLDSVIASALYASFSSDTGQFQYANVTSRTHEIIADLLSYGVPVDEICRRLWREKPFPVVKLQGLMASTLSATEDGSVVWAWLDEAMCRSVTGMKPEDMQNFVDVVSGVRGAEIALLFREEGGCSRVSLRAHRVSVNEVAKVFGGGGHRLAAGCTVNQPLAQAIPAVVEQCKVLLAASKAADPPGGTPQC